MGKGGDQSSSALVDLFVSNMDNNIFPDFIRNQIKSIKNLQIHECVEYIHPKAKEQSCRKKIPGKDYYLA